MSNRLKVSIIEPVGGYGGMEYYDYGLAIGLDKNDVEVTLFTCNQTLAHRPEQINTLKTFGSIWSKSKFFKLFKLFSSYFKSFRIAKRNSSSIVHFQFFQISWFNMLILMIARPFKFKKVLTLHDVDPLASTASGLVHSLTYKAVHAVIVHNEFSRRELLKKRIKPSKIYLIPHGNYLDFVKPLEIKSNFDGIFTLLFFGQIKELKGLDILIDAMEIAVRQNQKIKLLIAGRPWRDDGNKYLELIQHKKLENFVETNFTYIPNEEVSAFFEKSDLVILPYKRIYQSGVLLLAMSYGKPCLTSDLDSFKEIITDGENGFLFESESSDSLARKILSVIENKEKLKAVSGSARELLIQDYNWEKIGLQSKKLYQSILADI